MSSPSLATFNFYIFAEEDDELDEDAEFEANCNEDTDDEFEEDEI